MASCNESSDTPSSSSGAHFALLDTIVPGFSIFSSAMQASTGVDLNVYIPVLLILCGVSWCWSYIHSTLTSLVEQHLMCSVRIRPDDEIFNMIMSWVAMQDFSQRSRRFMANTNVNSKIWFLRWAASDDDDDDDDNDDNDVMGPFGRVSRKKKKLLHYTPSSGKNLFWFRGRPMFFERNENREAGMGGLLASEKEEIYISCFGRSPQLIKELLHEARAAHVAKDEHKTIIYRGASDGQGGDMTWRRCMSRSVRPFSTVILDEASKKRLIDDISDYLTPSTRRWYANRGIPYRRGYLLHGPPGTGKSSLSLALAGFFKMRIYILSLSSPMATEENVSALFQSLPRRCVVLLEDIDSAGLTHTRESDNAAPAPNPVLGSPPPGTKTLSPLTGRLSLSGLLNILDGVASQEGRVLIMTTNHIEKLDSALIRPGRVDMTVDFGRADASMTASIFKAIYCPYDGEETPEIGLDSKLSRSRSRSRSPSSEAVVHQPKDTEPQTQPAGDALQSQKEAARTSTNAKIEQLAQAFASRIPDHEFSPAEIQGLLLQHKHEPLVAIAEADAWIARTRREKAEKQVRDAEDKRREEKKRKQEELAETKRKKKEKNKKHQSRGQSKKQSSKDKVDESVEEVGESSSTSDSEDEIVKAETREQSADETLQSSGEESEDNETPPETSAREEDVQTHKKQLSSDSGYGTAE